MAKLKPAQIAEVKGKGFLINRGTENFSGRIVPRGTVFSPDDLKTVSEISSKFGKILYKRIKNAHLTDVHFLYYYSNKISFFSNNSSFSRTSFSNFSTPKRSIATPRRSF